MMRRFVRTARHVALGFGGLLVVLAATLARAQAVDAAPTSSLAAASAVAVADVASAVSTPDRASTPKVHAAAPSALAGTKAGGARAAAPLGAILPTASPEGQTALALRVVIGLTLLAILPSLLICTTAFLRIIVVLSMLRTAIGMPETPPNPVLIGLALFLTLFTMQPVFQAVGHDAVEPFMQGRIDATAAYDGASKPLREFMIRQTREHDLALMVELSKAPQPHTIEDVGMVQLVPAFILSELRAAFQIGFVIFLPFLLIDLIVSSILMALGMMMMPPVTVSLPLKILMFVLVDGWSLILKALVGSFH